MPPIYRKLEEEIRNRIASGEWKAGTKVPSEIELCEQYGLSRSTVRKSIESLVNLGYLERVKGKGTFVKSEKIEQKMSKFYSFSEEFRKKGMREEARLMDFQIVPANAEVARNLEIREGEEVFEVVRTRLVNGTVYAFEKSFIPASLAEGMTGELVANNGLYRTMGLFHINPDSAVERLTAIVPSKKIVAYLGTDRNAACMHIQRVATCLGRPVEFCESYTKGDMFSYTVELK